MDLYNRAKEVYEKYGVDVEKAIEVIKNIRISIHCWQMDDITGFASKEDLSGGIAVTGNYPYKARNATELREDLEKALSVIPFKHKINLHSIYHEGGNIPLDEIEPKHFEKWVNWAKTQGVGLDFNPTLFSHPMASSGFTLSSNDKKVRDFWIRHVKASRKISEYFGKELGIKSVCNIWIPDGYKDTPYSRLTKRKILKESLDEIFSISVNKKYITDTLESKLFGLGVESYTTGSHEFYLSYAVKNNIGICLDSGHFHPTETIADKISAIGLFVHEMLLHVSRGVRWDSDHVVILDDDLSLIMASIVRDGLLSKVHIGLDYFDASINRVAAIVLGVRNVQKALLKALLEPTELLKKIEEEKNYTKRLVLMEELKSLPFGVIYDYVCKLDKKPLGADWYKEIEEYEKLLRGKRYE